MHCRNCGTEIYDRNHNRINSCEHYPNPERFEIELYHKKEFICAIKPLEIKNLKSHYNITIKPKSNIKVGRVLLILGNDVKGRSNRKMLLKNDTEITLSLMKPY